jgi:hypothetical protein
VKPLSSDPDRLRAVLISTAGNITHAAELLGVAKSYLMEIVRKHELNEFCAKLRHLAGAPHTGRPPRHEASP